MAHDTLPTNANETNKQSSSTDDEMVELIEKKQIEGTPFTAVRHLESWFLTLGRYRLSEKLNSYEECVADAKNASWMRIMQIIQLMIEEHEHFKNLQTKSEKLKAEKQKANDDLIERQHRTTN